MSNMWDYRDSTWTQGHDLVGYSVEATDGSIGKIDKASDYTSTAYLVVDTGPCIFGKKRLIPAGTVTSVDHYDHTVSRDHDQGSDQGRSRLRRQRPGRRRLSQARRLLPLFWLLTALRQPVPS